MERLFFKRPAEASEGAGHSRLAEHRALLCGPPGAVLAQRGIWGGPDLSQQGRFLLAPDRPGLTRTCLRGHRSRLALTAAPALQRRRADAAKAGELGWAEAGVQSPQQPVAEVDRVLLHRWQSHRPSSFPQVALSGLTKVMDQSASFRTTDSRVGTPTISTGTSSKTFVNPLSSVFATPPTARIRLQLPSRRSDHFWRRATYGTQTENLAASDAAS
jgi:hypothetical protein